MKESELKDAIITVIKKSPLASVATISGNKPKVRYMMMTCDDDLTLFTSTFAQARTVNQIESNNAVELTLGGDIQNVNVPYITIEGNAYILTDDETKKRCWCDALSQFFAGPTDPHYAVVKIIPQVIEYRDPHHGLEPQVYTCHGSSLPICENTVTAEQERIPDDDTPCDDRRGAS